MMVSVVSVLLSVGSPCDTIFQKPSPVFNGVSTAKPDGKKGPQSAIANMFAKADQKKAAKPAQTADQTDKKEAKEVKTDKKVCRLFLPNSLKA